MEENKQHIDKKISSLFENHDFGTPPQAFIDDLNQRLDADKKGGMLWRWIIDFLFILLLLFYNFGEPNYKSLPHSINSKSNLKQEIHPTNDVAQKKKRKKSLTASNQHFSNTVEEDSASTRNYQRDIDITGLSINENLQVLKSEMTDVTDAKRNETSNKIKEITEVNNTIEQQNKKRILEQKLERNTINNKIEQNDSQFFAQIIAPQLPLVQQQLLASVTNTPVLLYEIPTRQRPHTPSHSLAEKEKKEKSTKNSFFHIGIWSGITYGIPKMKMTYSDNYLQALEEGQENTIAPIIGLTVSYQYKNIVLATGVEFYQIREDNEYQLTMDTTKQIDVEQTYSWLSIPLTAGYKFILPNCWSVTPRVGGAVAFSVQKDKLNYPSPTFTTMKGFSSKELHWMLDGGIIVKKQFFQWNLMLNMGYRYGITPVIKEGQFDRRYGMFYGGIGIGYVF